MITDKTSWYQRHAFGSFLDKGICKLSFGYTHFPKKVSALSNTSVHAAITSATSAQTVTTGITNPDVPRNLLVKPGGTAASVGAGVVRINGTNVEGKIIFEDFALTDGNIDVITGVKAFKTVTSIVLPPMDDTDASVSVGCGNALGLNHRLYPSNTTAKVVIDNGTTRSLDTVPTISNSDTYYIEENTITPATVPDAAYFYTVYYIYDSWTLGDLYDNPAYLSGETSTSTSTSSTSVSTSTSSTSTSSTSSSTSSTSSSTSSTSTSTTTVP